MLISSNTYEDVQFQADAPIGPQQPLPSGDQLIELSWDRSTGYMRIIIDGKTWWFKEFLGKAVVTGTDNERGRIYLWAKARLDGETLVLYRPSTSAKHPVVEGEERGRTHNRMCYRRSSRDWRLRDERMNRDDPEALNFVSTYMGDLSAEWDASDRVAHVFHNGWVVIDEDDVAHLYDPDLEYDEG